MVKSHKGKRRDRGLGKRKAAKQGRRAVAVFALDPSGFNEISMCRDGPMLYNKGDVFVGGALRKYGEYCWLEQDLFRQAVRPGDLVVEAGANFGTHTVALSRLAGPKGAVLAFEPQRIVFQALCANLALNHCANVFAYQEALGATEGETLVPVLNPETRNNFGGVSLLGARDGERVRVRALDSLELPVCRLIKADVEGMEGAVLSGAKRTIARHRPLLYVENDRPEKSKELIEVVFGMGYDAYWHLPPLFNPDNYFGDPEDLFPGIFSINMFCVPSEKKSPVSGARRILSSDDAWNLPVLEKT